MVALVLADAFFCKNLEETRSLRCDGISTTMRDKSTSSDAPAPAATEAPQSAVCGTQDLSDRQVRRRRPGEAGRAPSKNSTRELEQTHRRYVRLDVRGAGRGTGSPTNWIEPADRGGGRNRGKESRSQDRAGESRGRSLGRRSSGGRRLPLDTGFSRVRAAAAVCDHQGAETRRARRLKFAGENLLARAFCHEIDHLNGILFFAAP